MTYISGSWNCPANGRFSASYSVPWWKARTRTYKVRATQHEVGHDSGSHRYHPVRARLTVHLSPLQSYLFYHFAFWKVITPWRDSLEFPRPPGLHLDTLDPAASFAFCRPSRTLRQGQGGLMDPALKHPARSAGLLLVSLRDTSSCPGGALDNSPAIYGREKETSLISVS